MLLLPASVLSRSVCSLVLPRRCCCCLLSRLVAAVAAARFYSVRFFYSSQSFNSFFVYYIIVWTSVQSIKSLIVILFCSFLVLLLTNGLPFPDFILSSLLSFICGIRHLVGRRLVYIESGLGAPLPQVPAVGQFPAGDKPGGTPWGAGAQQAVGPR